jgi:hypothetical protein
MWRNLRGRFDMLLLIAMTCVYVVERWNLSWRNSAMEWWYWLLVVGLVALIGVFIFLKKKGAA